jgi:hypothetical protein
MVILLYRSSTVVVLCDVKHEAECLPVVCYTDREAETHMTLHRLTYILNDSLTYAIRVCSTSLIKCERRDCNLVVNPFTNSEIVVGRMSSGI